MTLNATQTQQAHEQMVNRSADPFEGIAPDKGTGGNPAAIPGEKPTNFAPENKTEITGIEVVSPDGTTTPIDLNDNAMEQASKQANTPAPAAPPAPGSVFPVNPPASTPPNGGIDPNLPTPGLNNPNLPTGGLLGDNKQSNPDLNSVLNEFKESLTSELKGMVQGNQTESELEQVDKAISGWTKAKAQALKAGDFELQSKADTNLQILATKKVQLESNPTATDNKDSKNTDNASDNAQNPVQARMQEVASHPTVVNTINQWQLRNANWYQQPGYEQQSKDAEEYAGLLLMQFVNGTSPLNPGTTAYTDAIDNYLRTKYNAGASQTPAGDNAMNATFQSNQNTQSTLGGTGQTNGKSTPRLTQEHLEVMRDLGITAQDTDKIKAIADSFAARTGK